MVNFPLSSAGLAVSLRHLRRAFDGGVVAIEDLSLEVAAGEFVALLGPSGCGKSTLLRLIARLDRPDGGTLTVGGAAEDVHTAGASVSYVFQDPHLMPWRNIVRNVALPLELRGVSRAQRLDTARHAIELVGLADAAGRYPNQLSGGMRMRVSLARALVTQPKLLLLDEPFAALDELTRQRLDEQLHELWLRQRMTVLFVTHSIAEAAFLARRAIVFTPRPARIILDHAVDLPEVRAGRLRGEASYAAQMRILYEALERGEAREPQLPSYDGPSIPGGPR